MRWYILLLNQTNSIEYENELRYILLKVYCILNINNKEFLHSIDFQIPENIKISELIRLSVDKFNENFINENKNISFKNIYSHYELRPSKKNGHPKMDLPCIYYINFSIG